MIAGRQNEAIARLTGWKNVHWYEDNAGPPILSGFPPITEAEALAMPTCSFADLQTYGRAVPNYVEDANAMLEVERGIPDSRKQDYLNLLSSLAGNDGITGFVADDMDAIEQTLFLWRIHTAQTWQRAKAYLLVMGQWIP